MHYPILWTHKFWTITHRWLYQDYPNYFMRESRLTQHSPLKTWLVINTNPPHILLTKYPRIQHVHYNLTLHLNFTRVNQCLNRSYNHMSICPFTYVIKSNSIKILPILSLAYNVMKHQLVSLPTSIFFQIQLDKPSTDFTWHHKNIICHQTKIGKH